MKKVIIVLLTITILSCVSTEKTAKTADVNSEKSINIEEINTDIENCTEKENVYLKY